MPFTNVTKNTSTFTNQTKSISTGEFLLLEDGSYLLLENGSLGSRMILEGSKSYTD